MKILLIDDDTGKCKNIVKMLRMRFDSIEIRIAESVKDGISQLTADNFDLLILDMTLPTFTISSSEDGGRPQPYGGKEILRRIDRMQRTIPTIVVTAYDKFGEGKNISLLSELDKELANDFSPFYLGAIYYSTINDAWCNKLIDLVITVAGGRND